MIKILLLFFTKCNINQQTEIAIDFGVKTTDDQKLSGSPVRLRGEPQRYRFFVGITI